ncbi:lysylphosphatidylglycerol synthase domain-containing protein [uncultured Desulfovibrio sp.]|uniref:lysylphosphatidylglycerol synthase domain-containing protein n=2 Tax=uncultured Desulfovibrio sp. TaxID=167968 RepID=UPI0025DD1F04|nr:lysylphosphatidylglycerol synthase domain-containing protein [uncultured Desulfovibrio sp.]
MKKYLRYLGPLLVTGIFLLAVYLLYHKLKAYSIAQIRESIQQISYGRIGVSLVLMVINYMILVGYDWLALKAIHKKLPLPRVGLVSFVGQAVSYNFGALLGGTSVRYRFYSAWGFSLAEIVRLVLMLAVTFWVGALGLCGVIFLLAPPYIPEELLTNMPIKDVRVLGLLLTLVACSYLVLCFTMRKPVHIFGREFVFPAPRIAVAQCIVAGVDIVAAAACMYVLLPGDIGISFLDFLPSYLMAQVAVVLTHIPGGVGVFELVILELSHTSHEQAVFAAVLLFRLIYYILPLLAAALLLAAYEARQRRSMLREAGRWLSVLSHSISAYLVFVAGLILLVSATLPTAPRTIALLTQWLPMGVLGVGHFVCALSGAALLFVAYGLERRQARAFHLATGLLCFGIIGALLKGLAWEPALMVAVVLLAVCLAHRRFYRRSFFWEEPIPAYWLFGALAALGLVFLLGWFLYHPAWDRATTWGFERPFNASRTLRAFLGITVVLMVSWCWRLLLRQRRRRRQHRQRQA